MSEWRSCFCFFAKRLIDGSKASGHLMKRWVAGAWQYRRETDDEQLERVSREAV